MKPSFIVVLLISMVNLCTASMIFLDDPYNASLKNAVPKPAIEIKWGDF